MDNAGPLLIGRHGIDPLRLPSGDSLLGGGYLAPDDFVFLAHRTLGCNMRRLEDELHAAGFARSVLLVAVSTEAPPLVVAAVEDLLFIEAHG